MAVNSPLIAGGVIHYLGFEPERKLSFFKRLDEFGLRAFLGGIVLSGKVLDID